LSNLNEQVRGGITLLRHHDKAFALEVRHVQFGARVCKQDVFGGASITDDKDEDTIGDVLCASHWKAVKDKRKVGGWAYAWPATMISDSPFTLSGPSAGGGGAPAPTNMRPIQTDRYAPDTRFTAVKPAKPNDWPSFPLGFRGIALAATEEYEQVNLFMPTDPRLIAVHAAGDVRCGSLVCDLAGDSSVASNRTVPLQSHLWVIRNWGPSPNSLAWNINLSQQSDTLGGLVVDLPSPAGDRTTQTPGGGGQQQPPTIPTGAQNPPPQEPPPPIAPPPVEGGNTNATSEQAKKDLGF
jgi:hypothetical protein